MFFEYGNHPLALNFVPISFRISFFELISISY